MSTNTRKRYSAEYLYPGSFFPEETCRDLPVPTFESAVTNGPDDETGYFKKDRWYAVRIRTHTEKRYTSDDGDEQWLADGKPQVRSYIVGRLVHYEDPELADDRFDILRSNIRSNSREPHKGWGVLTRAGNWQIASDFDEVVEVAVMTP